MHNNGNHDRLIGLVGPQAPVINLRSYLSIYETEFPCEAERVYADGVERFAKSGATIQHVGISTVPCPAGVGYILQAIYIAPRYMPWVSETVTEENVSGN